ncbi:MAG TPA: hypothetical protein VNO75_04135 [Gemmatimonadaceae bacterium]|nr:hypothetical protein [Gemmatimonadaceae bacterium]
MALTSLQPYRDRARAHQEEIDLRINYLTVNKLAARWGVAASTVRDIPREELPYKEFGSGVKLKRRRYHPDDVLAFEARDRRFKESA